MTLQFTNFEKLFKVIKDLGVTNFPQATISGWEETLLEGLLDLDNTDDIVFGKTDDVLLAVNPENGNIHKIILYIPQRTNFLTNKWGYPKYHLFHCETKALENFLNDKNNKYRISSKTDGKFHFKVVDDKSKEVIEEKNNLELEFCGYCMRVYRNKFNKGKTDFNLESFLSTNLSGFFRDPTFKYDYDDIPNLYTHNWKELATKYKKQKRHICESCQWQPKSEKDEKYIHAHHIDGLKYNNKLDNIKILCIHCHADQDDHSHMKKLPDYINFSKHKKVGKK